MSIYSIYGFGVSFYSSICKKQRALYNEKGDKYEVREQMDYEESDCCEKTSGRKEKR